MEQGNETDSIVVTAKNCRSLIGKRVSIALPRDTKKVVDFVDKTEDKEKVANNKIELEQNLLRIYYLIHF